MYYDFNNLYFQLVPGVLHHTFHNCPLQFINESILSRQGIIPKQLPNCVNMKRKNNIYGY